MFRPDNVSVDGLAMAKFSDGHILFRLWEMKIVPTKFDV